MNPFSSRSYQSAPGFNAYPRSRPATNMFIEQFDPVVQKHLRRVYSALFSALSLAAAGSLLTLELYARRQEWVATLATYLTLPLLLMFNFQAPNSKWRAPTFYAFAFVDGAAAAPLLALVSSVDPRIPVIAFAAAASVFFCCTVSALLAKRRSYLFLGSFCFTALLGLGVIGMVSMVWTRFVPYSMIMYVGLLVFCGYVLYDTQLIIERAHAGELDHLRHALDLLVDFIAIFKRIAIIMAKNKVERKRREKRKSDSN